MSESDERNGALREVYQRSGSGAADRHVVFVSHWFRDYIGCVDVRPAPLDCRVIHNPIDTQLFAFRQKAPEGRFRRMSVRPFVSLKYGNDLTVAAIPALSEEPWFAQTSISLCGRDALFEETVAPLRRFANVRLENRLLTPSEIAREHAGPGIFIGPRRSDSRGVSLGEAMSSGLVTVSNDCQAISEFVPSGDCRPRRRMRTVSPPAQGVWLRIPISTVSSPPRSRATFRRSAAPRGYSNRRLRL